jgi:hypothetical protein
MRASAGRVGLLPIQHVLRGIESRGVDVGQLRALEVFGREGDHVTQWYADRVASLDIWELEQRHEPALRRRFPHADVKITDSFQEIEVTSKRYDFVMIDNPLSAEEHFALFPALFRALSDDAVVALLVVPYADPLTRRRYPQLFTQDHLARRKEFYRTDSPEHVPLEQLAAHYGRLAEESGHRAQWWFAVNRREIDRGVPRRTSTFYLVLGLRRVDGSA